MFPFTHLHIPTQRSLSALSFATQAIYQLLIFLLFTHRVAGFVFWLWVSALKRMQLAGKHGGEIPEMETKKHSASYIIATSLLNVRKEKTYYHQSSHHLVHSSP